MFVMGNRKIRGPSPYSHMGALLAFSFVINLLYLIGPIFMMQVYDRVLPSGSVPTLVGLLAIAALLYLLFGVMDHLRSQLVISRGEAFADSLSACRYIDHRRRRSLKKEKKRGLAVTTTQANCQVSEAGLGPEHAKTPHV